MQGDGHGGSHPAVSHDLESKSIRVAVTPLSAMISRVAQLVSQGGRHPAVSHDLASIIREIYNSALDVT